jgi:tetratricopeptide (TPR) repeat protein
MNTRITLCSTLILLAYGSAQAQGDLDGCGGGSPDSRIAACTALVQQGSAVQYNFAQIYNSRGVAFAAKGQFELAILDFNSAIAINPNLAIAYSNRGSAYEAQGVVGLALDQYRKAIEIDPNLRQAYNNRCFSLVRLHRAEDAIPDCDKAIQLQPSDPKTRDLRGFVYFNMGRYADAIRDFNAVLAVNFNLPTALHVRGLAKLKMGDPSGQTDLELAKNLDQSIEYKIAKIMADFAGPPIELAAQSAKVASETSTPNNAKQSSVRPANGQR